MGGLSQRALEEAIQQWTCLEVPEECAICLVSGDLPYQSKLRLPCGHAFCVDCVSPWLIRCALCPMCRQDIRCFNSATGGSSSSKTSNGEPGLGNRARSQDFAVGGA